MTRLVMVDAVRALNAVASERYRVRNYEVWWRLYHEDGTPVTGLRAKSLKKLAKLIRAYMTGLLEGRASAPPKQPETAIKLYEHPKGLPPASGYSQFELVDWAETVEGELWTGTCPKVPELRLTAEQTAHSKAWAWAAAMPHRAMRNVVVTRYGVEDTAVEARRASENAYQDYRGAHLPRTDEREQSAKGDAPLVLEVADLGGGRGLYGARFTDFYDRACAVQDSSTADEDTIWLGVDSSDKLLLTKEHVAALLPLLAFFSGHGHLPRPGKP